MNKIILTLIVMVALSFFSFGSIIAKDKNENEDKKENKVEKKEVKKDCKKECGIALNNCNTETSKIDKAKKDERKANHEKCQKTFTECKNSCK
jgi:hypothetical protein